MNFKEQVYYSLTGNLVEPIPNVENLFAEGKPCEKWYGTVLDACERLYERLGAFEDEDVDAIVTYMMYIQQEIALKMYEYGAKFKDM